MLSQSYFSPTGKNYNVIIKNMPILRYWLIYYTNWMKLYLLLSAIWCHRYLPNLKDEVYKIMCKKQSWISSVYLQANSAGPAHYLVTTMLKLV